MGPAPRYTISVFFGWRAYTASRLQEGNWVTTWQPTDYFIMGVSVD